MFKYIDHLFPSSSSSGSSSSSSSVKDSGDKSEEIEYNKLVLHFTIDDIQYAEKSVDDRMVQEMKKGVKNSKIVSSSSIDYLNDIINVNAGGPYGSRVLQGVLEDSDRVWATITSDSSSSDSSSSGSSSSSSSNGGHVGHDWYKAIINIHGNNDADKWTASSGSTTTTSSNSNSSSSSSSSSRSSKIYKFIKLVDN